MDMKITSWLFAVALLLAGCALADTSNPPTATAADTPAEPATDPDAASTDPAIALLDRLETRGSQLKTYQAKVTYIRTQPLLGDEQVRAGTITYQSPPRGNTTSGGKFAVRFTHLLVNEALRENRRSYIFDGTWLAEVDPENKQFIRRQVVAPGSKSAQGESFNPLALGQGPFPVPLGQKRAQVLGMFHATIIAPTDDDPADTVHLHLTPRVDKKTGKPLSRFATVDIWYDKTTLLPVQIVTEDDSQNITTVKLKDAQVDQLTAEQAAKAFDTAPPPQGSGWKVEIKPYEQEEAGTRG